VVVQPTSDLAASLRSTLAARVGSRRAQLSDVTAGVSSECDGLGAPQAWREAQIALRFAAAGTADAVIVRDELGPVAMLAEVPVEQLRNEPGVLALDKLAATAQGKGDLAVLDAFCRTGSRRRAAGELHMHHSSVNARLAHVEKQLGWTLDLAEDRFRAQLVLYARRLARTPKTERR
jgi:DNA-binding PucR family transcriptional regulator